MRPVYVITLLLMAFLPLSGTEDMASWAQGIAASPHRLAGSDESARALEFIESRLTDEGVDVFRQPFPVMRNVVVSCYMEDSSGIILNLNPLRANALLSPVTPPGGLTGVLSRGLPDLSETDAGSVIVVADGEDPGMWRNAFAMGASAVVFTADFPFDPLDIPHTNAPVNLPRYYYDGPADELPVGQVVKLFCNQQWEEASGTNLIVFVEGTTYPEEVLVVSAPVDSLGAVPALSPGGWNAWNASALMDLAVSFSGNPGRRSLLFAFLDGEARGLAGSTAFYDLVAGEDSVSRFDERRRSIGRELEFIGEMDAGIAGSQPLTGSGKQRILERRMKLIALERQSLLQRELSVARIEAKKGDQEQRITRLEETSGQWTDFLRALDLGNAGEQDTGILAEVLDELRSDLRIRTSELELNARRLSESEELVGKLSGKQILLHVSLAFGDSTRSWGILFGGGSGWRSGYDLPGLYGRVQRWVRNALGPVNARSALEDFVPETVDGRIPAGSRLWGPQPLIHGGEVAGQYGIFNVVAGTIGLSLPHLGTPMDRTETYDSGKIRSQVNQFGTLLERLASGPSPGLRRVIWPDVRTVESGFDERSRATGPQVWERNLGRMVSARPLGGVVMQVTPHPLTEEPPRPLLNVAWYDDHRLLRSDRNGTYRVPGISEDDEKAHAFGVLHDEQGLPEMVSTLETASDVHIRMNMVRTDGGSLRAEPSLRETDLKLMGGRSNSLLEGRRAFFGQLEDWVFWHVEPGIRPVKVFGEGFAVRLSDRKENLNTNHPGFTARRSALDLWELNESRLEMLEDGGIVQSSLEALHRQSAEWIGEAQSGGDSNSVAGRYAMGFWTEGPVYERIMSALNDIVIAVLFLLLLTIPFAVALERLVIGAVTIERRIAGFTGFFAVAFLGFYLTHPAFDLSPAPLIIFLGFGILLLSSVVIVILMRRFEGEIQKLQGIAGTAHGDQVSRIATIAVAMQMGISTMRRRPMRTTMSILTVALLTFAILMFASFSSSLGIVRQYVAPVPGYEGLTVMKPDRSELPAGLGDRLQALWPESSVSGRWWLVQKELGGDTWPLLSEDGSRYARLRGILGIDMEELTSRPDLREVLGPMEGEDLAWLSEGLAARIQVEEGDRILVNGIGLTIGRILGAADLAGLADLTGEGILPVDFTTIEEEPDNQIRETSTEPPRPKDILPPDSVVIVSGSVARKMGADLHAINLYPGEGEASERITEQLARALGAPVIGTRADGVYWHTLGIVVKASGLSQLVVPILLGALVIFGTLLGSVVDREREIYTFSALGLAPAHVASLFLAESMIYAIVGGVAGFLGTQGFVGALDWVASTQGWTVPEINYSSMNAIVSLLILMATVMASALYPALRASRSANPGLMRRWQMPEPDGDMLHIEFPFTVSSMDYKSVLGFLLEHFENFRDSSLGSFMTWDNQLDVEGDEQPVLNCHMALTPYDLGVTQSFHLESRPGDIEGIAELHIRLERLSGQPANWFRLNKRLLHDLRSQMLLWRALTNERMEHYRLLTRATMEKAGTATHRASP